MVLYEPLVVVNRSRGETECTGRWGMQRRDCDG